FPELWWSDGTPEGTQRIKRLDGNVLEFATLGNRLYFIHSDDTYGQELWETDGSERGTRRLSTFPYARAFTEQPDASFKQHLLLRVGNQLLFEISGGHDSRIWWLLKPGQK